MIHNNTVCLLVEGGTITFDEDGVHGSTGEVNPYLGEAADENGRRRFGPLSGHIHIVLGRGMQPRR